MLKIGKNWGKIANYPPYAQQSFAPLDVITNFNSIAQCVYFVSVMYLLCYCRLMRSLSKVETRRDNSARIVLNCFQCIAYVFECKAVKMI